MPAIPATIPSYTQTMTMPSDLGTCPASIAKDAVVDGLAAIGLSNGWVIFLYIVLIMTFSTLVLFWISAWTINLWEDKNAKKLDQILSRIGDLEKGLGNKSDRTSEKAKYEKAG
ncbi:hypothetical protein PG996_011814 [Apiospora saccharicola]|uniref:Uncharacterized protein n=1 Tax=Apiospora saccharicola TaxID=335842 RepID=A0ABR1UGP1_9PEZI